MKKIATIAALFLALVVVAGVVFFWSPLRNLIEYDLDENTFGSGTMRLVERESGLDLPEGARGLRFHHIPPIDPIYFAKIEIPVEAQASLQAQIERLIDWDQFANDRCDWWPVRFNATIISRRAALDGKYTEAHLILEGGRLILFLKCFSI